MYVVIFVTGIVYKIITYCTDSYSCEIGLWDCVIDSANYVSLVSQGVMHIDKLSYLHAAQVEQVESNVVHT